MPPPGLDRSGVMASIRQRICVDACGVDWERHAATLTNALDKPIGATWLGGKDEAVVRKAAVRSSRNARISSLRSARTLTPDHRVNREAPTFAASASPKSSPQHF